MEIENEIVNAEVDLQHDHKTLQTSQAMVDVFNEVFENEMVLDIIMQNYEDPTANDLHLPKCRLVDQKWKRVATNCIRRKYWKNRVFVDLLTYKKLKEYLRTFDDTTPDCEFYSCFRLERELWKTSKYNPTILEKFFDKQHQQIKSLILGFEPESRQQLENILESQSTSLIELKVLLVLYECNLDKKLDIADSDYQLINLNYLCLKLPILWSINRDLSAEFKMLEIILSKIPQGKKIKLCLLQWDGFKETIELLQKYDQLDNLKVLEVSKFSNSLMESGQLSSLASAGVKLQFFSTESNSIYHDADEIDQDRDELNLDVAEEIYEFLRNQASHLEMLNWGSEMKFKFPRQMSSLKKLRLSCKEPSYLDVVEEEAADFPPIPNENEDEQVARAEIDSSSILYEQIFPKLQELELHSGVDGILNPDKFLSWVLPQQFPCYSLRKLTIEYCGININSEITERISVTFPLITTLIIKDLKGLMSTKEEELEFYRVLWNSEFAPILENLYLDSTFSTRTNFLDKYFLDSIFSGVNEEKIKEISKSASYSDDMPMPSVVSEALKSGTGSILHMTSLKTLIIDPTAVSGWNIHYFTDFSAIYLFAKIQTLEFFHLDKKNHHFSQAALDMLKANAKESLEKFKFCSDVDPIEQAFATDFNSKGVDLSTRSFVPVHLSKPYEEEEHDDDVDVLNDCDLNADKDIHGIDLDSDSE